MSPNTSILGLQGRGSTAKRLLQARLDIVNHVTSTSDLTPLIGILEQYKRKTKSDDRKRYAMGLETAAMWRYANPEELKGLSRKELDEALQPCRTLKKTKRDGTRGVRRLIEAAKRAEQTIARSKELQAN